MCWVCYRLWHFELFAPKEKHKGFPYQQWQWPQCSPCPSVNVGGDWSLPIRQRKTMPGLVLSAHSAPQPHRAWWVRPGHECAALVTTRLGSDLLLGACIQVLFLKTPFPQMLASVPRALCFCISANVMSRWEACKSNFMCIGLFRTVLWFHGGVFWTTHRARAGTVFPSCHSGSVNVVTRLEGGAPHTVAWNSVLTLRTHKKTTRTHTHTHTHTQASHVDFL
jgi:hypothetical protein